MTKRVPFCDLPLLLDLRAHRSNLARPDRTILSTAPAASSSPLCRSSPENRGALAHVVKAELIAITQTLGGAELYGADTGWINFANRTFETTVNIVGGTKQYDGASGQLVATGNLTPTGTIGTYTGEICKHHD